MRRTAVLTAWMVLVPLGLPLLCGTVRVEESSRKIGEQQALIVFELEEEAVLQFFYGEDHTKPDQSVLGISPSRTLQAVAQGLKPGTLYYYQAHFYGPENKRKYYATGYFTTKGNGPPRLDSVRFIPDKYSITVECDCTRPLKGHAEVHGTDNRVPLVLKGRTNLKKHQGASLPVHRYTASLDGLKPMKAYQVLITGRAPEGGSVSHKASVTTLENNIALNRPVEGTFGSTYIADRFELTGDVLKRANDGKFGYKDGMAVSGDPEKADQWIVVDLGKEYPVDRVRTFWRSLAYPLELSVELGPDGREWPVTRKITPGEGTVQKNGVPLVMAEASFNGAKARFVRVFVKKGTPCHRKFSQYTFVQLMELKVYPQE